ncbi:hypothetical protein WCWAEYFT_CDS0233 [Vibrio phage VB_VaC_TDDLMA]
MDKENKPLWSSVKLGDYIMYEYYMIEPHDNIKDTQCYFVAEVDEVGIDNIKINELISLSDDDVQKFGLPKHLFKDRNMLKHMNERFLLVGIEDSKESFETKYPEYFI